MQSGNQYQYSYIKAIPWKRCAHTEISEKETLKSLMLRWTVIVSNIHDNKIAKAVRATSVFRLGALARIFSFPILGGGGSPPSVPILCGRFFSRPVKRSPIVYTSVCGKNQRTSAGACVCKKHYNEMCVRQCQKYYHHYTRIASSAHGAQGVWGMPHSPHPFRFAVFSFFS